jgi:hypothetical protein
MFVTLHIFYPAGSGIGGLWILYVKQTGKGTPHREISYHFLETHTPIKLKKIRGPLDYDLAGAHPFGLDLARSAARIAASSIGRKGVGEIASHETAVQAA